MVNFFNAVKFAVLDYDSKLKLTKTPMQRFWIWTAVTLLTAIGVYTILLLIGSLVRPLLPK